MRLTGNTTLVKHGIQTENSHLRVHVCPREKRVYVYPTECGVESVMSNRYPVDPAHQEDTQVVTAMGCWIPPMQIRKCVGLSFRDCAWDKMQFSDGDELSVKGTKALNLTLQMIKQGLFPGSLGAESIEDKDLQIEGQDIIIKSRQMPERIIQVKCDYAGGRNGLFLQLEECNPFHQY